MDIDSNLRMLMQVPMWAQKVTYIKGSALNDNDLERARLVTWILVHVAQWLVHVAQWLEYL